MDRIIKLFMICILVATFLTVPVTLAWWPLSFYKEFVGLFFLIGLGSLILSGRNKDGQELFASSLGTVVGSAIGFYWLIPFLAQYIKVL